MNKELPKLLPITILLTTYKRPHYLKKTIELINERTLYPFRLIVVDNNSQDGTKEYLKTAKVVGKIFDHIFLPENIGQSRALNKSFALMEEWQVRRPSSDLFVTTNDDLFPPDLRPCWLERMVHLFEKHEPNGYGGLCMRIQRTSRLDIDENKDIIECHKSFPCVFRMARRSDYNQLGDQPFGRLRKWDSHSNADMFKFRIKKKFGMTTKIYADHVGFQDENKGYAAGFTDYMTYAENKVNLSKEKPYPDIHPKTNVPMKLNSPADRPEHEKREEFWGLDTGVQNDRETNSSGKVRQRELLGEYCKPGLLCLDIGCGDRKCAPHCVGIDTYPGSTADIIHAGDDLWFYKDNEVDVIVACHCLEHFVDTKGVLKEWDRVLKPGGILAFIVPDGGRRPKTIIEPSHKVALTEEVIRYLLRRFLGHKLLRVEPVPDEPRKKCIIAVSMKRNIDAEKQAIVDKMEKFYAKPDPWGYKSNPEDDKRKKIILNALHDINKGEKFQRALDIGCGEGWITTDLPARKIHGYDVSKVALSRMPTNITPLPAMPTKKRYDLVTAMGVLYKEYDYQGILNTIRRTASRFVLTCNIKDREINDLGVPIVEFDFPYREFVEHLCIYDLSSPQHRQKTE